MSKLIDHEERLDEVRAEIQNINQTHEGRRFPDAVRERWNELNGEADELAKTVDELRKRNARLRAAVFAGHGEHGADTGPPARGWDGRSLPALQPDADQVRQLHRAALGGQSLRTEVRAVVTSALSGADQLTVPLSMPGRMERRIAAAGSLAVENVAGITSAAFPVFGAGDAGITAEGAAKTEYDTITAGTVTPQMITIFTDTTRQNVLTMLNFEAKLRSVLAAKVSRREDLLLAATVLADAGIQALIGALSADAVLEAAALVAAGDVAAEPNLVLLNPADVPTVLGPDVGAGGSASPGFEAFLPVIHGMRVYPTTAVTAGEALVGAWNAAAHLVVGLAPTFLVDAVSGIKTNTITILLEEAVALAVDEPQGFVHIRPV